MAYLKIVLVALMLVLGVSAMRLSDQEDQDVSVVKRAACKCDDDGPDIRSATLTGTVDFWNCNEGWEKCTAVYTAVASCCRKKKG
uniref:Delta-stichotoxin-Shd3a n=1 Tax=Stichodactyla haddoni TaxID=475174 RepID=NA24_STIHA|nr:RecName: Full=Delta-stichotoxin-Shd3a; Short=Delta-SHTX-Shd3a; AltName: Full=Sodium channel toxin SHTX IV; AltName: Full=Sodium channel toxin SHTX-4; Flags: Precursor [Stichodactyla haddoni]BAG12825.1 sodium channel peptide toxin [Stichodactyla haddoni]